MSIVTSKDFVPQRPDYAAGLNEHGQPELQEADPSGELWAWTEEYKFDPLCFLCDKRLTVPFVFYAAPDGQLCLHPECAGSLGAILLRDGIETTKGKAIADQWHANCKQTWLVRES